MADPALKGSGLSRALGFSIVLAGFAIAAGYTLARFVPDIVPLPFVPFFDRPRVWGSTPILLAALVAVALTVTTGMLILQRSRLAPHVFVLAGWGGLAFAIAALWPGRRIYFMMQTAVTQAERAGAPPGTTIWDLIPATAYVAAALVAAAWLAALLVGTFHVILHRHLYR